MGDVQEMTTERAYRMVQLCESRAAEGEVLSQWMRWLFDTRGEGLPDAVLDAVYGRAWDQGHSSGLHEVELYFVELVEFAQNLLRIAR